MRIPVRDKRGSKTAGKLVDLVRTISPRQTVLLSQRADVNIPQFNFPRQFWRSPDTLRVRL